MISLSKSVETEELDDATKSLAESVFRPRPAKITEEEVKFYREQTICLVCKEKLGGFDVFLCYDCKALYCEKCAKAIIKLENACWACYYPIDRNKPVKLREEEEEKAIVEEEVHKKRLNE